MRLDFSHFTTEERHNLEAFKQALKDKVKKFAQKFALIFDDNLSAIKNLDQIFENAPSKSIVFLIDEYDVPLTENPEVTPPLPVTVEVRILLPYDFKQTTLDGDKQLVHISLVGLPAAAEIRIGQFHIAAAFFDIYFSWCVFHR